ncbi:MAG TPA: glycosyltransferase [Stellaceae bacterium]|nr:glycosyltransferase [Stellaceae bacterium]
MTASVLFYVQHLLGIGHLRRALHLCEALTAEGIAVTLVSGGEPLPELDSAVAARIVQLSPVRALDASFTTLVDGAGRPLDDGLQAARREALLAAFVAARPDAVIIEAFPFGRRTFRFELDPLIAAARARHPRALMLCSLRDIVVAPQDAARRRAIVERVRADFDAVLVHGDPALIPLDASFAEAAEIADRLHYTGYVVAPSGSDGVAATGGADAAGGIDATGGADAAAGVGEVLVSAGGGAVGAVLLATALEARRRGCLAGLRWRFLTGPNLPEDAFLALEARRPANVVVERYRRDFPALLRCCRVSVSQAGYNTVLDILAAAAAAVVVPFAEGRESEQTLRAERLAACGAIDLVPPDELVPERLAAAIEGAAMRRPAALALDTAGAPRTARLIAGMIGSPV